MNKAPPRRARLIHRSVQQLLPWFANHTLSDSERRLVERHLEDCRRCRDDLHWQQQLRDSGDICDDHAADAGLARLRAKLGKTATGRYRPGAWHAWLQHLLAPGPAWRHWLIPLQSLAIVVLGVLVLLPPAADYRALDGGTPGQASLLVMFRPEISERQLRQLLQQQQLRLVDGPTAADIYVLQVAAPRQQAVQQALRADPAIKWVQTLQAGKP